MLDSSIAASAGSRRRRVGRVFAAAVLFACSLAVAQAGAQPVVHWTAPQTEALRQSLADAPSHGLDASAYLQGLRGGADEKITLTALAYAHALAFGVVDPREIHTVYTAPRRDLDLESGLQEAVASGNVQQWLASLAPTDAEYRLLSAAYVKALGLAMSQAPEAELDAGPVLRSGDHDARLPAIAARLTARGFPVSSDGTYDDAMGTAVRRLQAAAGLKVDGIVGPATLAELNEGPRDRVRQLAVNLERRRWLARQPPPKRIDVNVATAQLVYVDDGVVAWRSRVVAGAPGHETPWMVESFDSLVLNPPWRVPDSIARAEILPRGQAYMRAHDMRLVDGRVVQAAGPKSALGQVKFDMRNPYAIYLHDTPAKALFEASERHRSHGCVRVENAVAFAERLAADSGIGPQAATGLASGATKTVRLAAPVTVRLMYFTAIGQPDGDVHFVADPYGWDDRLADRMGLGPSRLRARLPAKADLLGP